VGGGGRGGGREGGRAAFGGRRRGERRMEDSADVIGHDGVGCPVLGGKGRLEGGRKGGWEEG